MTTYVINPIEILKDYAIQQDLGLELVQRIEREGINESDIPMLSALYRVPQGFLRNLQKNYLEDKKRLDDNKTTPEYKNSYDYKQALYAVDKALDEPNVDPDDDLRTVSRQFIRMTERYEDLEQQVDKLAIFIMKNIPNEPSESEGAVDTAIRLLSKFIRG